MQSVEPVYRHSVGAVMHALPGGIVVLRLTGALTVEAIDEFGKRLHAAHGATASGYLLDYRTAVILATDDDLTRLSQTAHPDPLKRPAAFIVHPSAAQSIKDQCLRMALLGFPRRYFFEIRPAWEWVSQEARRRRTRID